MASRFVAARAVSAPAMRLVVARPWLSGTAALAAAVVALFGWFLVERWDDVEVTASAAVESPFINGSAHLPAESHIDSPAMDDFVSSAFEDGVLDDLTVAREWTSGAAAEPGHFEAFGGQAGFERLAARPAAGPAGPAGPAAPVARGAWLTGAIEDIDEDPPPRQARRLDSRGEWFGPAAHEW